MLALRTITMIQRGSLSLNIDIDSLDSRLANSKNPGQLNIVMFFSWELGWFL